MTRTILAASALLLTLLTAACGSNDDAASPTTDTGVTDTTEAGTDQTGVTQTTTSQTTTTDTTTTDTTTTDTTTEEGPVDYDVFLLVGGQQCDEVVASPRISTIEGAPAEALEVLLAGPTAEETAQGWFSSFTPATAVMLRSVVVDDGVARVDFDPALATTIPNASTSCGSAALLAQLDATITQFDGIDRAVYSLGGDVDAFYEWLQLVSPSD